MRPLAHHAGEQALAPLLLLAGGALPLLAAIARAQLAAVRAPLTRKRGSTTATDRSMAASLGPAAVAAQAPAAARPTADEPVTVLSSRRVKPGREADVQAWAHGIVAASRRFPGHLGAAVLDDPDSRAYHILVSFTDRRSLRVWLDSQERRRWLARVADLLEADQGMQQLTGLETWFKLPGANVPTMKPPPRWKMWLFSIVAVYPLVLAFQALVVPRMAGLPFPLRALSLPLVLLTLMTFVVMPVVTRVLRRWLGPRQDAQPVQA
jgi:antibiotic biosynthesis monooxygenase (ABM) superfamily enzyme